MTPETDRPPGRFEAVVEEGPPRGDLYELEQTTFFRVVDRRSGSVVLTFRGEMEASLSTDTGQWSDYRFSGVREVSVSPDGRRVIVRHHEGREETFELPR